MNNDLKELVRTAIYNANENGNVTYLHGAIFFRSYDHKDMTRLVMWAPKEKTWQLERIAQRTQEYIMNIADPQLIAATNTITNDKHSGIRIWFTAPNKSMRIVWKRPVQQPLLGEDE